jgi:HEAT repeat protein
MFSPKAAGLFGSYGLWRSTGLHSAGRALVEALGSEDEDLRTIAGMLLVRGGEASRPLLEEALRRREHLPMVISVLGDVGGVDVTAEIRPYAQDPDPRVADAAQQALRVLEFRAATERPR